MWPRVSPRARMRAPRCVLKERTGAIALIPRPSVMSPGKVAPEAKDAHASTKHTRYKPHAHAVLRAGSHDVSCAWHAQSPRAPRTNTLAARVLSTDNNQYDESHTCSSSASAKVHSEIIAGLERARGDAVVSRSAARTTSKARSCAWGTSAVELRVHPSPHRVL